ASPHTGLLGVALSGAGSTVVAFATGDCPAIAGELKKRFAASGVSVKTLEAEVDNTGRVIE
ncbi:MAG TPA: hypothetical protein VFQ92_12060, partial [Blastocatellia bacterium]|nr:hypothetical protein [Blastocatellia bacterium]